MKLKDFIEKLSKLDQESNVLIVDSTEVAVEPSYYTLEDSNLTFYSEGDIESFDIPEALEL